MASVQIRKAIGWWPEPLPLPAPAAVPPASWQPLPAAAAAAAAADSLLLEEPVMPPASGITAAAGGQSTAALAQECLWSVEVPDVSQLPVPPLATAFGHAALWLPAPVELPAAAAQPPPSQGDLFTAVCGGKAAGAQPAAVPAAAAEAAMLEAPQLVPFGAAAAAGHARRTRDGVAWAAAEAASLIADDVAAAPAQPLQDARFPTFDDIVFQNMLLEQRSIMLPHVDIGGSDAADSGDAQQVGHEVSPMYGFHCHATGNYLCHSKKVHILAVSQLCVWATNT